MKKKLITLLLAAALSVTATVPVRAESPYIWVQEGDNTYCYIRGEYDEDHLLTGWHQIDGEIYWFEDSDFSDEHPIGSMARNEWRWINDAEWHFDECGHLDEWRIGLE